MRLLRLSSLASLALLTVLASAQTTEPKKEEPKPDPKIAEYEKAIKDLPKHVGPVTVYIRKKEILLELNEAQLGKLFFLQGTWNTGFSTSFREGFPLFASEDMFQTVDTFRFEKQSDDRVWLTRPNTRFRWSPTNPNAAAIQRTFPTAYYSDFRIEQTHPEKKLLLINATGLFSGDLFGLTKMLNQGSGLQVSPDREKTRVDKVQADPATLSLRMEQFYNAQEGGAANPLLALFGMGVENHLEDNRSVNFKLTYSFYFRDDRSSYRPRLSDARVGYFTNDHFSFDRYYKDDRTVRYINRWNLQKKDPNAAMSEPVKPITWVLDHSIPVAFRECFRRGILDWNNAFEKIGFKNAVVVVDPPTDPNYDHADSRQNVIRWTVTNSGDGAIALFRTDPMTGEIMNASVNVDGTFAVMMNQFHDTVFQADPVIMNRLFRQSVSDAIPGQSEMAGRALENLGRTLKADVAHELLHKNGWHKATCNYSRERAARFARGMTALEALGTPPIGKQKFIEDYIQDTVAHEIGHTMGLRHNFAASTNLTTTQLSDEALVRQQGMATSVMDYIDVNMAAVWQGKGVFINPGVRAYDMHAIRYGYEPIPAATPEGELFTLNRIATQGGKDGLKFMTDEDADRHDPTVQRWDAGKDPLHFGQVTMHVANRTMKWAIKNLPKPGESYARRNAIIQQSLTEMIQQASRASRYIGGLVASRTIPGDVNPRAALTPVNTADQRKALTMATSVLAPDFGNPPDQVLNSFVEDFNQGSGSGTASLRSMFAMMQQSVLGSLMNAGRISRIIENEYKLRGKGAYTVTEHYDAINRAVMSEILRGNSIRPLRRDLQRNYVIALLDQAGAVERAVRDDAQLVALATLKQVRDVCYAYLPKANGIDKLHARQIGETITLFLNRQRVVGVEGGGGGGGLDLAALLGGKK